jgi:hypothetical protein
MIVVRSPEGQIITMPEAHYEGNEAYEGWEVLPDGVPMDLARQNAMEEIGLSESAKLKQVFPDWATIIATIGTWTDIKRAERDIEDNTVPPDDSARAERYPFLWAIGQVAGIPIEEALVISKTAVIADMTEIALAGARALVARYQAGNATTKAEIDEAAAVIVEPEL